jgi:hypothetical protein
MTKPTESDVYVSAPLSNMSVAYMQSAENFAAMRSSTIIPVDAETGKYFTFPKADWFIDPGESARRGDATESAGGGYSNSTANFSCDTFAWHKDVGHKTKANTKPPLDWRRNATQYVTQILLQRLEGQFVSDLIGTSIWETDVTPTNLWSDHTNSRPIKDVETGKRTIWMSTGFMPNTLVLGYHVWEQLRQHPDVIERLGIPTTASAVRVPTPQALAAIFEVDRVVVAMSVKNTAAEGATATMASHVGKNALLAYVNQTPALEMPSAWYLLVNNAIGGGIGTSVVIREIDMPLKRNATRIEGEICFDFVKPATDLGYFFSSVVA